MKIIIKCNSTHTKVLKDFLKNDMVYNTFILADIDIYGFDKSFQDVYMKNDDRGNCESVYLKFHNNLILAGDNLDLDFIDSLLKQDINIVMGKDNLIKQVNEISSDNYIYCTKYMYSLYENKKLLAMDNNIETATLSDVDDIYEFLQTIEGFENMYKSKDMIINRIKSGEGFHLFLKRDGKIISHANSAAKSEFTTMIGGIATAEDFRGKNLAKEIVSLISKRIILQGRVPCTFCDREKSESFLTDIGFKEVGKWGTLEKIKEDIYE